VKDGQTDFLDEMEPEPVATATPEPAAPTPEPAPADSGQPRDDKGRYATKAEQDAAALGEQGVKPEAQPAPAPEPPAGDEGPHVPRAALEAERKKRQALEAELAKLKPAASAQPQSPPTKSPEFTSPQVDFEQDPRAYLDAQVHSIRMGTSWDFAVMQSSDTEVNEAWSAFDEACKTDPAVNAWSFSPELKNHRHPIGEVLKWHRKQKQMAQIESAGGLDAFIAAKVAEAQAGAGAQPAPAMAAAAAVSRPAPPTPPPSPARGGNGVVDAPVMPTEDEDFDGFFAERKPRKR
jgi:hypothetical protein